MHKRHMLTLSLQPEIKRLDIQHVILKVLLGGRNWFAPLNRLPLKRPRNILDIGCGTGLWCKEMGLSKAHNLRCSMLTRYRNAVSSKSRGFSNQLSMLI